MAAKKSKKLFDLLKKLWGNVPPNTPDSFSIQRMQIMVVGGIIIAEIAAMAVVYNFRFLPYHYMVFLDAGVMLVIITPLLYFLSFRPFIRNIQQRFLAEQITQSRLRLMEYANTHSLESVLQKTLDEVESLTGSNIGFFHFLDEAEENLSLQAWSTNTLQSMCKADGKGSHYPVQQAGVWADCIRQRKPIIHNNYAEIPNRKGLPEGHAVVLRELVVPIIRQDKIVAILGVGNKNEEYTENDVHITSTLADYAWDVVQRKQAEMSIFESESKFRTLADWTFDWELWVDPQNGVVYSSPSCERITGFTPEDFMQNPALLDQINHPDDMSSCETHQKMIHDTMAPAAVFEYRIVDKNGQTHWIEHICRPLLTPDARYLGRRISNRDITERKLNEQEIFLREQNEKKLTEMLHTIQMDIARDLHDTVGQNISYLRMKLDHFSENPSLEQDDFEMNMHSMSKVADETYDLIRGTLTVLQIRDTAEIFGLFERYAKQVAERAGFEIAFTIKGDAKPLSAPHLRQLFLIFREVLNNIEKHAHADQVEAEMRWEKQELILRIKDNGNGFEKREKMGDGNEAHYGLKFMRERTALLDGTLEIDSAPKQGTQVVVNVPLQNGS